MLQIFNLSKKKIGVFDGYDAFLGFITSLENQKLLEDHPSFGRGYWAFAEYSPEKLKHVCAWIKPGYLTTVQLKALEQKLGVIEVCRGNSAVVQEIPITPELDVDEFKKKFCLDYCQNHHWRLIETQDYEAVKKPLLGEHRYVVHPYTRKNRLAQMSLENKRGRRLKSELNCRIDRLRQAPLSKKSIPLPASIAPHSQQGEL